MGLRPVLASTLIITQVAKKSSYFILHQGMAQLAISTYPYAVLLYSLRLFLPPTKFQYIKIIDTTYPLAG